MLYPHKNTVIGVTRSILSNRISHFLDIRGPSMTVDTALQLALLAVLADWNVTPAAVVGHSSGKIAAAVAAGYMSSADAIRTAYLRGYGSKQILEPSQQEQAAPSSLGMLAVGVGPDVAQSYLDKVNGPSPDINNVYIAGYSSLSSLAVPGPVSALTVLGAKLKDDGHFARLLQVDLAYHSPYMASVAFYYKKTLEQFCHFGPQGSRNGQGNSAVWFSSVNYVTGKRIDSELPVDAEYWKSNMVMPVQFNQALSSMILDGPEAANEADLMLIEIGPSNALAGPVSQVDKAGNQGLATKVKYCSALKRGANSVYTLLAVAGQLFAVGVPIPLAKVNGYDLAITDDTSIVKIAGTMTTASRVVVDLPNYQWDHSTRYWHEGPASRGWRHRPFVTQHLLGAKVLGTPWSSPTFSKVLHLADVAWLRDHKIGEQRLLQVECTPGLQDTRNLLSMDPPVVSEQGSDGGTEARLLQPWYETRGTLHPVAFDSVTQAFIPALWKGDRAAVGVVTLVLDLICHKLPHPNVLEIGANEQRGGVVGDRDRNSSVSLHWLPSIDADDELNRSRADACASYHFVSAEPQTLLAIQDRYSLLPNASFSLADITMAASVLPGDSEYDLAIVNVSKEHSAAEAGLGSMLKTVHGGMRDKSTGYTVVVLTSTNPQSDVDLVHKVARTAGFEPKSCALREKLGAAGWNVSLSHVGDSECGQVQPGSIVLVCDELYGAVMSKITQSQWDALQMLISKECRILWLTTGAVGSNNSDGNEQIPNQMHPERAAINGLMRSVRREEPHLRLITLDLSPSSMADGVGDASSIQLCLQQLLSPGGSNRTAESEFAERQGILHISRIAPDAALNRAKLERADVYKSDLFDPRTTDPSICVQLRAERLGNIDSLCFAETALPSDLPPNHVEVEVHASGLNYKDVAVTMGLVPADEYRLGEEAAGVVVRVAPDVTTFQPGQRVVVFSRASLANRVRASTERVHAIPDAMSFEDAATLCVVYITAMHALFNLGGLRSGMRVLVHSATGGVGNAAIQLCRSVGDVEIFATVGSDAKKQFLVDELHMPADHVFSSRTPEFVQGIRRLADGAGVDLVLNSLTGPLLESSWHLLAPNGTFVEIGKRDMLARQALPMEPFTRNVSYRALDTSPRFFPDSTINVVMADLFRLLEKGAIKRIFPRQTFSYSRVADAFRLLRQGTHMGKLVVSREHVPSGDMVGEQKEDETKGAKDAGTVVSIRQSPHIPSQLRSDVCHLIVGGLGGLGGSLAVYLAKEMGAKNIATLSRSANVPDKDVKAAFCKTKMPIGGIVHGAMVLRDRPFATMTMTEYHDATGCKIAGALNLHQAALDLDLNLDYFSLLSSISGIVGGKGQANYAAGNAVLDALAAHRRAMGLPACAVDLGAVEDVGYIASHQQQAAAATQPGRDGAAAANHDYLAKVTAGGTLTPINERLLRKIIQLCLLQQQRQLRGPSAGAYQMITGLTVPQPEQSDLPGDARFAALFNAVQPAAVRAGLVRVVGAYFAKTLRLEVEQVDVERPLSGFGIDSMAAVEIRNWVRAELGVVLATFEIINASSIIGFCDVVISKLNRV
uniref:Carrier domain-containing protein n=1 Tax=Pyricularia oryzae (strain 70-15 / ATCC MYA-4617 / FGSC 8958) TaxID=242507 RepID=Q2KHC3_PYRO7|nr:hypothetical protein MGCH7_ch7g62 [Pyricularia oryzae 70-15]